MSDEELAERKKARDKKTRHWYDIPLDALLPEEKEEKQSPLLSFDEQMRLLKEKKNETKPLSKKEEEEGKLKYNETEAEEEIGADEIMMMDFLSAE